MPGDPNQEWPSIRFEMELPSPTSKTLAELNRLVEEIQRLEGEAAQSLSSEDRGREAIRLLKERYARLTKDVPE